jgi:hypothetical protein
MQIQEQKTTNNKDSISSAKMKFEEISSTPVTRDVTLKYRSCCVDVMRTVPYDSPFQNGDRISDLGPNDKMI